MFNSSTGGTQMRRNRPCWKLLTPTVLLSVVILAMAPSFYGFDLERVPMGTSSFSGGLAWARSEVGFGAGAAAAAGLGAGGGDGTQQEVVNKRSPFAAASWFKERVRDGNKRIHTQVMSMVPEATSDADPFKDAPVPAAERGFLVNGWRWHARVVLRDVERFRQAALMAAEANVGAQGGGKEGQAAVERVVKCYSFLWTFSWTKLHQCETDLLFPWLRQILPRETLSSLKGFDRERDAVIRIGNEIGRLVVQAHTASGANTSPRAALLRCAELSEELGAKAARLSKAQEAVIVPYTAAFAGSKEQLKFNDKVIYSLGLMNAQVFLVAMHDVVKFDQEELKKFRAQVPKYARALIPTWRRVLYSPMAGCLEEVADAVPAQ